ncbi:hypothetical protein CLV30_102138 [Haloactinopolyspora alba]|uniref:Uncharacterized protein n=1 Tax=Haloactinopolyspora alba TaxID=648780 RepID=A0A2P8EBA8_9ACTN|nr:hypothetical protein [Haloactinopolyspora alba]PSL06752.1 hypothetical protein CLV30_102138 [Haloactinopolyspora alba]
MSRYETTRHQRCSHCGRNTLHSVIVYDDSPWEIIYCTECGR